MITLGEKAEAALRVVREAKVMAYDTETSGVDWHKNSVVGYVITASLEANFYIPVRHGGGGNLLDPNCTPLRNSDDKAILHQFEQELAAAFQDRRRLGYKTIGHHLGFDMHMSANHGIYLGRNCEDTQHNAAILDEYARSYSLANCATRMGVRAKKGEELYEHLARLFGCKSDYTSMGEFWRTSGSDPLVVDYATGDGITTLELTEAQRTQIENEDLQVIHQLESDLIWTVFRMERRGIKADTAYIDELITGVDNEIAVAERNLPRGFNTRSPIDVRKFLEASGHTNWPTTAPSSKFPDGQPSFNEKWLKTIPPGKLILTVRQLTNLKNTFVLPLRDRHVINGRVHAQLHQLKADEYGTIAGRFSCSDPNLQAIHKRNKDLGRRFRRILVADEGMEFYEADYKQMEPCLFAHYSQEPALIDGYRATPPRDMHQVVADMLNVERDPTAKRMNMGILTGMQTQTFSEHMGWDLERATNAHNQWFEGFPLIRNFQNKAKAMIKATGFVKTILGRRCRMDFPQYAYRATSKIIQGGNADIIKEKLKLCDRYLEDEGDKTHLLMTVHDSLNWQTPLGEIGKRHSAELIRICKDVEGPPFNLRVPLGMDVGHGKDWATATYGPLPPSN